MVETTEKLRGRQCGLLGGVRVSAASTCTATSRWATGRSYLVRAFDVLTLQEVERGKTKCACYWPGQDAADANTEPGDKEVLTQRSGASLHQQLHQFVVRRVSLLQAVLLYKLLWLQTAAGDDVLLHAVQRGLCHFEF